MVTGSAELAATQIEQWDLSRVLATDLQSSLQNMKGGVGPLLGALASLHGQLVSEPSHFMVFSWWILPYLRCLTTGTLLVSWFLTSGMLLV